MRLSNPVRAVGWLVLCAIAVWLPSVVAAATCSLAWDQVTQCTDGSACPVLGYRLYAKPSASATYPSMPTIDILATQLADATRPAVTSVCAKYQRWVVTAYDEDAESAFSDEAVVRLNVKAPTNLTTKVFP